MSIRTPIRRLIVDIETIGDDFATYDETTQKELVRWIKQESRTEEAFNAALEDVKRGLGFSPLTGEIACLGALDYDTGKATVYFQAPTEKLKEFTEDNVTYKPMSEAQMLDAFWKLALQYQQFVTFNGRQFDMPFIFLRSAIHGIRPTKDVMRNRYISYQDAQAVHIDLYDQLTFYGAMIRKGTLHRFVRAFGIESPKDGDISGDEVTASFRAGRYLDIAKYNARDLYATRALFDKWDNYLRF